MIIFHVINAFKIIYLFKSIDSNLSTTPSAFTTAQSGSTNLFANVMKQSAAPQPMSFGMQNNTMNVNNNTNASNANQFFKLQTTTTTTSSTFPPSIPTAMSFGSPSPMPNTASNQFSTSFAPGPLSSLSTQPQQSTFATLSTQNTTTSFPNNTNQFAQLVSNNNQAFQQPQQQFQMRSNYYSFTNDLNDADMQEYNANEFTLGRIPFNPPSENLIRRN